MRTRPYLPVSGRWDIMMAYASFTLIMRALRAVTCIAVVCVVGADASTTAPVDKGAPNVLFIIVDDLNDAPHSFGGAALTPNIDRLASAGIKFTNAHCQATWCSPSRTSLLTGLRPSTSGIYTLTPWFRDVQTLKQVVTLPQLFSRNGFETFAAGKVYHDGYPPAGAGAEFDVMGYQGSHGPTPERPLVQAPGIYRDFGVFPRTDEEQEDWKVVDSAIGYLRTRKGTRFFATVGIRRPHFPLYASQRWFDLYPPDAMPLPEVPGNDRDDIPAFAHYLKLGSYETDAMPYVRAGKWRDLVRAYLACVSFVDSQVGRLVATLEETGELKNTLIVFTSDHGHHLGEKMYIAKRTLWERSTRVPLIFAGPGVPKGKSSARAVELLDVYPTLADLCGIETPSHLEGISLRPWLENSTAPRERPAITSQMQGNFGIRDDRWRYIRYADGSEELYDMQTDPNEWLNLAKREGYSEILTKMRRWIPEKSVKPAPGSEKTAGGFLTYEDGEAKIDGKPVLEFADEFRLKRR